MVDEHDGGVGATREAAQEAEDGGDLGDGVVVNAVEEVQGVEDQEARPDALQRSP